MSDSRVAQNGGPRAARSAGSFALRAERGAGWGRVQLLDAEPDLGRGLSKAELEQASDLVVPAIEVPAGPWSPPEPLHRAMAVIVLAGQLFRSEGIFARPAVQLLGPGDLGECQARPESREWRALQRAQLAVLDDRFLLGARRWPGLMAGLAHRLIEAQQEQQTRTAICTMPRVEERILALLCHLAGRWGRVTPDGVALTLPITHALLGALIGSRRSTVSLALHTLHDHGFLDRHGDGTWLLPPDAVHWPTVGVPDCRRTLAA
jgi:CRP/FNR family transcriptional regulator, cyclic AMP receptor protein